MIPVWIAGERIYSRSPFAMKDTIKALPGALWDPQAKAWHVPATATSAAALVAALDGRPMELDDGVTSLLERAATERGAAAHKTAIDLPEIPGRLPAWLHQKRAFHFGRDRRATMLAMDMGTGKSRVAISLMDEWEVLLVVLLCPRSVMAVWPNQFATHSERDWVVAVPPQNATVLKRAGFVHRRIEQARLTGNPICVVVNYEAAWRKPMKELLLNLDADVVVMDESHRIKAPGGKQSVFCGRLARGRPRVLQLTGTPMPHSPLDLYGQFRALDPGVFGTSFNRFRNRYAIMGGFEGRQVIGYQQEPELARKFGDNSFVVRKDEAGLDLPPVVHSQRIFELGVKSFRAYKTLEEDFILGVGNGTVTATNALVKLLRLQQVTSGYVRDDDGVDHEVGDDKIKVLADLLDDIPTDEPVVIFCRFKHDLKLIRVLVEEQGRKYGEVSGTVKPGNPFYGLNEHSQMRSDIDVIALQIQSGGVGIDLTRSCLAIYYSLDFSLGNYDQTLARLDRPGQTRSVTYFHLIAKDTKDPVVYQALDQRRNVVEAVIASSRKEEG